jgi:hypothetical protein
VGLWLLHGIQPLHTPTCFIAGSFDYVEIATQIPCILLQSYSFFFLTCDTIWWAKNHHLWPKLMPDHFQSSAVRPTGWDALQVAQQVNYVARESSEWCSTKLQGRMQTS